MTTLAIIGSGIAARSLLYTLAKEKKKYSKIYLFSSEKFIPACSLRSTAVVAPRGVTRGVSPLGDLIMDGHHCFLNHLKNDRPLGVESAPQYIAANEKLELFLKRFPNAKQDQEIEQFDIGSNGYLVQEEAALVNPSVYLSWLLNKSKEYLQIEEIDDLVINIEANENQPKIKTQTGKEFKVDVLVMCGGAANRYWLGLAPESILKSSKRAKGSYLEYSNTDLNMPSFALTFNNHSLVYRSFDKVLLVGNTTSDADNDFPEINELQNIHHELNKVFKNKIPPFNSQFAKVGIRDKAQKRSPYIFAKGKIVFMGGFYKNGYLISLFCSKKVMEILSSFEHK